MATNLALDDRLIERVKLAGGFATKKAAVTAALEDYLQRRERQKVRGLFGAIDYEPDYDYKAARRQEPLE